MKPISLFLFLFCTHLLQAQVQCTFIGAYNGQWSIPEHWSCGHVPDPVDDVVITELIRLNVSAVVNNLDLTYNGPTLYGAGALTVNGTFNMQANVENTGGITVNGTLNWLGYTFQGVGTVNCNGTNNIGASGNVGIDEMTVSLNGGGDWTGNDIYMCCGGVLHVPAGATLEHTGGNGSIHDYGMADPKVEILGTFKKSNAGTISVNNSTDLYNSGTISLGTATSVLHLNAGAHTFHNSGLIEGNGTLNILCTFAHTGSFSPGLNGIGKFTINEDLPTGTTNTYIELQGTGTPGTDYDQIVVVDQAVLSGTLNISFLNNFTPSIGNEFIIMTCPGGCSGSFSNIVHPGNNPGAWAIDLNTPGQVKLKLVESLPVELLDFSAKQLVNGVDLQWQTASESDNHGFHIERMSADHGLWEEIGFVEGHGTTTEQNKYAFLDENPLPGISYYRLQQVDFDGSKDYSNIVSMEFPTFGRFSNTLFISPNPVYDEMLVTIPNGAISLEVYDVNGRRMILQDVSSMSSASANMENLQAGVYFVQVKTASFIKSARILKE